MPREIRVVLDRDDAAEQRDLRVPAVLAEDGQGDGRVLAHVAEAQAALVHVQEDAAVLPVVPGGGGVRLAGRAHRRDDRRVRPGEERVDLGRDGHGRHERRAYLAATGTASVSSSNLTSRTARSRTTKSVLATTQQAAEHEGRLDPDHHRDRPRERIPGGEEDHRAHPAVRRDARELLRRDRPLQRRVPDHRAERECEAGSPRRQCVSRTVSGWNARRRFCTAVTIRRRPAVTMGRRGRQRSPAMPPSSAPTPSPHDDERPRARAVHASASRCTGRARRTART